MGNDVPLVFLDDLAKHPEIYSKPHLDRLFAHSDFFAESVYIGHQYNREHAVGNG